MRQMEFRLRTLTLLGGALFYAAVATAYVSGVETPGPQAVQQPGWMSAQLGGEEPNEHGYLLWYALTASGLPDEFKGEYTLDVFVDSTKKTVINNAESGTTTEFDSFAPAPFSVEVQSNEKAADGKVQRSYIIHGIAALPDHSLSLWDWANDNESCPSATGTADVYKCHAFKVHLGALNSSHFPPQSASMYRWYHARALDRAKQCSGLLAKLKDKPIWLEAKPFANEFVVECEREALLLEAFGQHFLQDAWSIGHMWQRWGGANLADFPATVTRYIGNNQSVQIASDPLTIARLVGITAGMIHGAEAVLKPMFVGDRMGGGAEFVSEPDKARLAAIGDYYASRIGDEQLTKLTNCSLSGVRKVYRETGMASGEMLAPAAAFTEVSDDELVGERCLGQRATNASVRSGMALDFKTLGISVPLDDLFAMGTGKLIARNQGIPLSDDLNDAWILAANNIFALASFDASVDPFGTNVANEPEPLLGIGANSVYDRFPPARYADPPMQQIAALPLQALEPQDIPNLDEEALAARVKARLFNRAHIADWCDNPETELAVLQFRVSAANSLTARQTACGICTEFASRHARLRVNNVVSQSTCELVTGSSGGIDESAESAGQGSATDRLKRVASSACGCDGPVVMLSSASGFSGFDSKVAVNNQGLVAFSATIAATGENSGFVAKDPEDYKRVTFAGSATRNFGGAAIMNASEPISAFRERVSGAPATFYIRKWTYAGSPTVVGRSPGSFDSAAFFVDVNDAGIVAFQALVNGSTSTALMAGFSEVVLDTLVSFAGNVAIRPQVSGSNDIVFRKPDGTVTVINYVGSGLPNPQSTIAGSPAYSSVGDRPGISSDGMFVAFTGSTAAGAGIHLASRGVQAAALSTLVDTSGDPASATGQFQSFGLDKRVAVANMAGSNGGRQIRVLFTGQRLRLAEGNAAKDGIYVVDSQLSAAGQLTPGLSRKILQVGDVVQIGGASETVAAFDLWDPLSDDGRVTAFWVSFLSGKQAILRQSL
jgi:hypothetical protein